jgi:hypothetical protein
MMNDVLERSPQTKHEGLTEFETRGYLLLDAAYTPVNVPGNKSARKKAAAAQITKDFPLLVAELRKHPDTQLVPVMANVRELLDRKLPFDLLRRGVRHASQCSHILVCDDCLPVALFLSMGCATSRVAYVSEA